MSEQPEYRAWRRQFIAERGRPPTAYEAWAAALASRLQEKEGQPSTFPARILTVLHELADRKGTPTQGPAEDANGEPLQDDADAALAWITARQEGRPALSDEQVVALNAGERFFSESPSKYPEAGHGTQYHCGLPGLLGFARATLAAGSQAVQVPGWRPIETAPASVEKVLIITVGKEMKVETGHYARNMLHASKVDGEECHFTHWMPLPAAPLQPLAGGEVK